MSDEDRAGALPRFVDTFTLLKLRRNGTAVLVAKVRFVTLATRGRQVVVQLIATTRRGASRVDRLTLV
ncbi:hypothetical protein ACVCAH_18565 [Micromonospora sp. LZ34]